MKVLHVDDEPDIRAVFQTSRELDPQFEVHSVSIGAACLPHWTGSTP